MNSVDPKFQKWTTIRDEFKKFENDYYTNFSRRSDSSLCLTHGFHYQNSYTCKDIIRCSAYRSNAVTEEFIVNYGHGTGHVMEIRSFKKDLLRYDGDESRPTTQQSIMSMSTPPLQHIVWLQKHRLFVGIGNDKNLRVYSDTVNRCRALSAPTVCAMPVLCMAYLEETNEVITAGIGVIQPWKIRLSTDMKLDSGGATQRQAGSDKKKSVHGGMPKTIHREFGQGRQMLQPCEPFQCHVMKDEWVLKLKVYNDKKSKYTITEGCKNVLVATSAEVIVAIDYVKRRQLWSARLLSTYSIVTEMDRSEKEINGEPKVKPPRAKYIIRGHVSLTACDFFPRFGYLITGGIEGMVQVMHMVNFRSVATLIGHRKAITGIVAHTTYPIVVTASNDKSIRIWCLETFRENQRIDTAHKIQSISLSDNRRFLFYHTKKRISMYYFHNHYALYSIPHSTAASLCSVQGDYAVGKNGKILAALADGSVALLSPSTGMMITMIYPMTTFQIFNDMVFDIYSAMCYIRLNNGSVLQCDCNTNPAIPCQRLVPSMAFDEDVCSIASVKVVHTKRKLSVTAVIAGLRNGQIVLVRPNDYWMENVQAHENAVQFLSTVSDGLPAEGKTDYCRDMLFSVSAHSVRVWQIIVDDFSILPENDKQRIHHGKVATNVFQLRPLKKLDLPAHASRLSFVSVLNDRICAVAADGLVTVVVTDGGRHSDVKRAYVDTDDSKYFYQNPEDQHTGKITDLTSSHTLRFFVSSCDSGYVKIWDEKNRLLRELCFMPHSIKSICFVNDRDILVSLEGRILCVECTTYLTKRIIVERRIADLDFVELQCEAAHPYDDDIIVVSTIEFLRSNPLCANRRTRVADCVLEDEARHMISEEGEIEEKCAATVSKTTSLQLDDYMRGLEAVMAKRRYTSHRKSSKFATGIEGRSETYRRISIRVRRRSRASLFNEEEAAMAIINRNKEKRSSSISPKSLAPVHAHDNREKSDSISKETIDPKKLIVKHQSPEKMLSSGDHLERVAHQPRLKIPSYGYIPNSVVRKRAEPSLPLVDNKANIWKNMTLEEVEEHWFKFDNFDDDTVWAPDEESSESESDHSEQGLASLIKGDISNYELLRQYYEEQGGDSITADDEDKADSTENAYTIEFDDENGSSKHIDAQKLINAMSLKDRERYQKYFEQNRERSSSARVSFRKLGNTLLNDDDAVSTNNRKKKGERVLKFRPIARATYDRSKDEHMADQSSSGTATAHDVSSNSSSASGKSDAGEEGKNSATETQQLRRRSSVSLYRSSSDLKTKLLQERHESKELAQNRADISMHPLLQNISTSPWFRRKLTNVNIETVANTLLEAGNTTRPVGQQKACEDLTRLVKEFGPDGKRRPSGDMMSEETLDRIRVYVASYLNPRYSTSSLIRDKSLTDIDEELKKNVNRIKLANNALECIENDIGLSKEIELGIIRLASDENDDLKERAMRLLKHKLDIQTLHDLAERLQKILERDITLKTVSSTTFEDKALEDVLQKLKEGSFTLAETPKMAERLKLVVAKRRLSGQDDESNETDTEGECTETQLGTKVTSSASHDSPHDVSVAECDAANQEKDDSPGNRPAKSMTETVVKTGTAGVAAKISTTAETKLETNKKQISAESNEPSRKESSQEYAKRKAVTRSRKGSSDNSTRLKVKQSGGVPNTRFPKINWKKAVPKSSKQTIKTMRTMRFVHHMATMRHRNASKRTMLQSRNEYNVRAPKTSEKSFSEADEEQEMSRHASQSIEPSISHSRILSSTEVTRTATILGRQPLYPTLSTQGDWRTTLQKLKDLRDHRTSQSRRNAVAKLPMNTFTDHNRATRVEYQRLADRRVVMQRHNEGDLHDSNTINTYCPPLNRQSFFDNSRNVVTRSAYVTIQPTQPFSYIRRHGHRDQYLEGDEVYEVHRHCRNNRRSNGSPLQGSIKPGTDEIVPAPPPSVVQRTENSDGLSHQKYARQKIPRRPSLYQTKSDSLRKLITFAKDHYKHVFTKKRLNGYSTDHGRPTSISVRMPSTCSPNVRAHHKIHD